MDEFIGFKIQKDLKNEVKMRSEQSDSTISEFCRLCILKELFIINQQVR